MLINVDGVSTFEINLLEQKYLKKILEYFCFMSAIVL